MDNTSLAYREGRYPEVFEAARSSQLRPSDIVEYRKSLDRLRDIQRGIKYETENARRKALEEGRAEGRAEGLAEGRAEGRAEGLAEGRAEAIAEKLKKAKEIGISDDIIAKIFGNDRL